MTFVCSSLLSYIYEISVIRSNTIESVSIICFFQSIKQNLPKRWPTGWPAENFGGGQNKSSVLKLLRHQESLLRCFPFFFRRFKTFTHQYIILYFWGWERKYSIKWTTPLDAWHGPECWYCNCVAVNQFFDITLIVSFANTFHSLHDVRCSFWFRTCFCHSTWTSIHINIYLFIYISVWYRYREISIYR